MAFLLGVTGGIGSGKSSVCQLLASSCQAAVVDVDQCCRQLLAPDQPGWLALRDGGDGQAGLGAGFFLANGELDRKALRERLFADAQLRLRVDALLHPLARQAMRAAVAASPGPLVLVEIPLLYEAGWEQEVDAVLVVSARPGARCCRIMRRDGVSRRQAARAIAAQMDLDEKARRADMVIDNSGAWPRTQEQVLALGMSLCQRFAGGFCQESA